jgi:hypothetical protein
MGSLLGHLTSTSGSFATIFTLSWVTSLLFNRLSSIHMVQPAIAKAVESLEVWLFYFDAIVCGVFLLGGLIQIMFKSRGTLE